MKILKFLAMVWMAISMCVVVTSCKDDDDDDAGKTEELIGTWEDETGDLSLTFKRNGMCEWSWYGGNIESVPYSYNGSELTLDYGDGGVMVYDVLKLTSTTLKLRDEDGDFLVLSKVGDEDDSDSDSNNSKLVGSWRDSYDDGWDEITFRKDGSFTWTLYEEGKGMEKETGTYTYKHPNLIFEYDDGYEDSYIVKSISASKLVLYLELEDELCTYFKK